MVKASRPVDPTLDEIGSPGKTMMLEWARATRTVTGTLSTPEPPVSVVSARAGPEADTATAAAVSRPAPSVIRRDRRPKVTCMYCTPLIVRVAGVAICSCCRNYSGTGCATSPDWLALGYEPVPQNGVGRNP